MKEKPLLFRLSPEERTGPFNNFDVLSPHQFLEELKREIPKAKSRVLIHTMLWEASNVTQPLVPLLVNAASRGARTCLKLDSINQLTTDGHINFIPVINPEKSGHLKAVRKENEKMYNEFAHNNVEVCYTNTPQGIKDSVFPYTNRNHIKMTIIDDTAYIGGLNFDDTDFSRADFMVKITDKDIVDKLAEQFDENPQKDKEIVCNGESTIIRDCGSGKSLILEHAVRLISQAEEVKLTTQLMIDGPVQKSLSKAYDRRAEVEVITSTPERITDPIFKFLNGTRFALLDLLHQFPPVISFYPGWLHAKALVVKTYEGKEIAIIGSHNFSENGVRARTKEIVLMSTNSTLITNLKAFFISVKQKC